MSSELRDNNRGVKTKLDLRNLASIFIGYFLLILWHKSYSTDCLSLLIPLIVGLIIAIGVFRSNMQKRYCIANCYFKESSMLYRILTSGVIISIFSFCYSFVISIFFLLSITLYDFIDFIILAIDILLIYFIYQYLQKKFCYTLKDNMKYTVLKNLSAQINVFLMVIILLIIQLNSSIPSFVDYSLTETINNASSLVVSECNCTNYFVKLNAEVNAIKWWLMINTNNIITDKNFRWIAWILFLLTNGITILGFSKYILQLMDFTNAFTNEEKVMSDRL